MCPHLLLSHLYRGYRHILAETIGGNGGKRMATFEGEVPLIGGRVTVGVVRVENTVRRPPTANSDFVRPYVAIAPDDFEGELRCPGNRNAGCDIILTFIEARIPDRAYVSAVPMMKRCDDTSLRTLIRRSSLISSPSAPTSRIAVAQRTPAAARRSRHSPSVVTMILSPCNRVQSRRARGDDR